MRQTISIASRPLNAQPSAPETCMSLREANCFLQRSPATAGAGGAAVGADVGWPGNVGDGVGDGVGEGVGDGVGDGVGEGVGDGVGDGVGAGVPEVQFPLTNETFAFASRL